MISTARATPMRLVCDTCRPFFGWSPRNASAATATATARRAVSHVMTRVWFKKRTSQGASGNADHIAELVARVRKRRPCLLSRGDAWENAALVHLADVGERRAIARVDPRVGV